MNTSTLGFNETVTYIEVIRKLPFLVVVVRENGGDTFFRNVGSHTDYAVLYPKRRLLS
jgi:hypothetical protein